MDESFGARETALDDDREDVADVAGARVVDDADRAAGAHVGVLGDAVRGEPCDAAV